MFRKCSDVHQVQIYSILSYTLMYFVCTLMNAEFIAIVHRMFCDMWYATWYFNIHRNRLLCTLNMLFFTSELELYSECTLIFYPVLYNWMYCIVPYFVYTECIRTVLLTLSLYFNVVLYWCILNVLQLYPECTPMNWCITNVVRYAIDYIVCQYTDVL